MNKKSTKNSLTPLIIIGLVLVIAVGGGALLYRSSTSMRPKTNQPSNKPPTPDSAQKYATAPPGAQPPNMRGSQTATVTVEEFADFQCGTCASKYPMTKELIEKYGSRIKFIFRNYPLSIPAHDKARDAAVAAEAAGIQDKFWSMQDQLFTNQSSWATSTDFRQTLTEYAQKIGLDVEKFKNDMAGVMAKERVDADLARGRALGVNSTPTFFINGKQVDFGLADLNGMSELIDAELVKTATANQNSQPAANKNK